MHAHAPPAGPGWLCCAKTHLRPSHSLVLLAVCNDYIACIALIVAIARKESVPASTAFDPTARECRGHHSKVPHSQSVYSTVASARIVICSAVLSVGRCRHPSRPAGACTAASAVLLIQHGSLPAGGYHPSWTCHNSRAGHSAEAVPRRPADTACPQAGCQHGAGGSIPGRACPRPPPPHNAAPAPRTGQVRAETADCGHLL